MHLKSISILLRTWNSRRPLLRLPTETLDYIMEYIPEPLSRTFPNFNPVWISTATEGLGLAPVTRTCHRLREVAINNRIHWRNLHSGLPLKAISTLVERNCDAPLNVVIDHDRRLNLTTTILCPRARELHLVHMDDRMPHLLPLFHVGWPQLEFLSFTQSGSNWSGEDLPLSAETTPRLRFLHLRHLSTLVNHGQDLPSLTHLSLSALHITQCHAKVAAFLASCPNLVNVVLDNITNPAVPREPQKVALPGLRRVTLQNMTTPATLFYLGTLQCATQRVEDGLAVQVISSKSIPLRRFPVHTIFPQYIPGGVDRLTIARHVGSISSLDGADSDAASVALETASESNLPLHHELLSITAVGPHNTVRLVRKATVIAQHLPRFLSNRASLSNLREVWIVDIAVSHPAQRRIADAIGSVLAVLPALETVVVVFDHHTDHTRQPSARQTMNMGLLPRRSDPTFEATKLKTLRLVHGRSSCATLGCRTRSTRSQARLLLRKMLDQLASHEYDYLDTLIVQTMSGVEVDQDELEEARMHYIPHVRYEEVDTLPAMPLPQYCYEPARERQPASTPSLW
ncbi:hypothetical protein C8Q80DRAFT_113708 [Daedaleopsis nitida]|nr:hypothetical protein C8Q80DRAFT_113708 [Daedaleopsis nitida]